MNRKVCRRRCHRHRNRWAARFVGAGVVFLWWRKRRLRRRAFQLFASSLLLLGWSWFVSAGVRDARAEWRLARRRTKEAFDGTAGQVARARQEGGRGRDRRLVASARGHAPGAGGAR